MLYPNYMTPMLAHLVVQQMRKSDIASTSLFPDIPLESLLKLLTMPELVEASTNPNHIPSLDGVPGSSQTFEEILQGLTDDKVSVEDYSAIVEQHQTRLANDRIYRGFWARTRARLTYAINAEEVQEFSDPVIEQFRNENPELAREVDAYVETLSDMFQEPDPEENAGVESSSLGPNSPDETPLGAGGEIEVGDVNAEVPEIAQAIGDLMPTAVGDEWVAIRQLSWRADVSILIRIIWRNLKHLQNFQVEVEKLQNRVKSLNQEYENREISPEIYELRANEALRALDELLPEIVSKSLDAIPLNLKSKVLGIKEEYRPAGDDALSANPEGTGAELADAFIAHIADGDVYFAAVADSVATSMTASESESFLTAIRTAIPDGEVLMSGEDLANRHSPPPEAEQNSEETGGTEERGVASNNENLNMATSSGSDTGTRPEKEESEPSRTGSESPPESEPDPPGSPDPDPIDPGGDDRTLDIADGA